MRLGPSLAVCDLSRQGYVIVHEEISTLYLLALWRSHTERFIVCVTDVGVMRSIPSVWGVCDHAWGNLRCGFEGTFWNLLFMTCPMTERTQVYLVCFWWVCYETRPVSSGMWSIPSGVCDRARGNINTVLTRPMTEPHREIHRVCDRCGCYEIYPVSMRGMWSCVRKFTVWFWDDSVE